MEEIVLKIKAEGGGDVEQKVKSIKQQLREAKEAALQAAEGSEKYYEALNKAAGLADQLKDVNETVNALNPGDKAAAFGNLINTVAGGFQTITGLYGLLGSKSEDVEKILLKVQAASALAMGIQSLVEAQKQWSNLKVVITQALTSLRIGVGAATGGVTILLGLFAAFSDQLFNTAEETKNVEKETTNYNKTAAEQLVKMNLLLIAAKDENKSLADRQSAVKQLNELSPTYLGNLTLETINTNKATEAVNLYTEALVKNARAQAAKDKLIDIESQILDAEYIDKTAKQLFDSQQRITLGLTESDQKFKQSQGLIASYVDTASGFAKQKGDLIKTITENTVDFGNKAAGSLDATKQKVEGIYLSYISISEELDRLNLSPVDTTIQAIEDTDNLLMVYDNYWDRLIKGKDNARREVAQIDELQARQELAQAEALRNAKLSIAQNTITGLAALGELLSNNGKKNTAFQKTLAIAQIAIDTARSIAATIAGATSAAATTGPAAPFVQIAYITSGIASVLAAMASAKKALQEPAISQVGGGGGNLSLPTASGVTPPNIQAPTNTSGFLQQDSESFKVFVVESDITNAQGIVQQNKKKAILTI